MALLRFLQFSDLHLDGSLLRSKLALSPEKRAQLNRDVQHALVRIVDVARSENVDVVLCPGDLWDDESISFESATFLYETLGSLAPMPVLIAPGNHDPFNAFSYHHPTYYKNKVGKPHPRNITVFGSARLERRTFAHLPDVEFYGCCFEENKPRSERMLRDFRPEAPHMVNVLLLHGSQDDAVRGSEKAMAAPFSPAELLSSGFDYAALGHYHRFSQISGADGNIRGCYSGVPVARGLDESGEHCVLVGEIDKDGVRPDSLKKIVVDSRRIVRVRVDIDSAVTNTAAACERIARQIASADVTRNDIVYASLQGRTHPEVTGFDFAPGWGDDLCFHVAIDQSALEPDYDLDRLLRDATAGKRVEGKFAERMKQLLAEAAGDTEREQLLRDALCYGLDALHGREVKPRHVD